MFEENIKTETIPERVYELCKMISEGEVEESVARERMEPKGINTDKTSYYPIIQDFIVNDLKLVEKNGDKLKYIGEKRIVKNIKAFRIFCNSIAFANEDSCFYKITQCFLESNTKWLGYSTLTDPDILKEVNEKTGIKDKKMILGSRFWVSFLGFGYIQEGAAMYYLPNMYVALQDFCELAELEKNREYSVKEFIDCIEKYASVAFKSSKETHKINLAVSNALREMHDNKEIILKNNLDCKIKWELYKDVTHEFTSEFSHIVYKGVKRV